MSYEAYKIIHILGLVFLTFGLFGLASVIWNGETPKPHLRKLMLAAHGIGLVLLLVAGFGLAARLGLARQMPNWIYAKLGVWLLVGALPALIRRMPQKAGLWVVTTFILILLAVMLAVAKPF